jgi:fructokinase
LSYGGSPFNTARALARLGQPVSFLGCISEDSLGQRLRGALRADGVVLDGVIATRLPTTLAFAQLDAGASAWYEFYTEGTSAPPLEAAPALTALPAHVETLHCGSLGLMLEALAGAVTAVVDDAASREALVVPAGPSSEPAPRRPACGSELTRPASPSRGRLRWFTEYSDARCRMCATGR